MANEYLTKSDIINWIGDWANNNPNRTDEAIEVFATESNISNTNNLADTENGVMLDQLIVGTQVQ